MRSAVIIGLALVSLVSLAFRLVMVAAFMISLVPLIVFTAFAVGDGQIARLIKNLRFKCNI